MTTTQTTQNEAAGLLELAWNESQRLRQHLSQRSMQEKRQMGVLEALVPRLKHLVKNGGGQITLNEKEQALLEALKPADFGEEKPKAQPVVNAPAEADDEAEAAPEKAAAPKAKPAPAPVKAAKPAAKEAPAKKAAPKETKAKAEKPAAKKAPAKAAAKPAKKK